MRLARICISATALALGALVASAGGAAAASPCAPGQPVGRPPGRPPNQPGPPPGRPPQYPPGQCQLRLSAASAAPRASVTAAGSGYQSGSSVAMRVGAASVGTAHAGADGSFTQDFTIPADTTPGPHDVQATGVGGGGAPYEQTATLEVLAVQPAQQAGTQLPVLGTLRPGAGLAAAPQVGDQGGLLIGGNKVTSGALPGGGIVLPGTSGTTQVLDTPGQSLGATGQGGLGGTGSAAPRLVVGRVGLTGPTSSGSSTALLAFGGGLLLAGVGAGTVVAARRRSSSRP